IGAESGDDCRARDDRGQGRLVADLILVQEGRFGEVVVVVGIRRIHYPGRSDGGAEAAQSIARSPRVAAERGRNIGRGQRVGNTVVARWIAKAGRFKLYFRGEVKGQLPGPAHCRGAIGKWAVSDNGRTCCGCASVGEERIGDVDVLVQCGVECPEKEDLVAEARNVAAKLERQVVVGAGKSGAWGSLEVAKLVKLFPGRIPGTRPGICACCSVISIGAGLGDHLNDAALGLAELRREAVRLYIHFLDEREVDAGAQRPVIRVEGAEAAIRLVSDGNAINDVQVLEAGGTANRGISGARAGLVRDPGHLPAGNSGSCIEDRAYLARHRDLVVKGVIQVRIDRGGQKSTRLNSSHLG